VRVIEKVISEHGPSAESCGILGRIYKDLYKEGGAAAAGNLNLAIEAYRQGFRIEPTDYYPGVNAVNLLIQKGTPDAEREAADLAPLVAFAVARKGGAASSDYWDVATVLELALIGGDRETATEALPRVLALADAEWKAKTTADNLEMLERLRRDREDTTYLMDAIEALRTRQAELAG